MSTPGQTRDTAAAGNGISIPWTAIAPIAVAIVIALVPAPEGLPQHAWYFFAIFVGVIVGLMFEPLPGGAIGLIGVTLVVVFSEYVFYSPEQLAKPGFNSARAALAWGLSGFSNTTVWLIFGAFMFALGYEKTGLGRRIALLLVRAMGRKTLTLGYAVTIADLLLAPFTPSNTARSGGTIYPVIRNLPPLYQSLPNDPSMRRMGSYLMWVAIAATCVTSSMFLTALAPNLLAVELVRKTARIEIEWLDWFVAFAPVGILLLALLPLLIYWICPPEVKEGAEVPAPQGRHLGRHHGEQGRVEHAGMVRHAGRARGRVEPGRIRQVVRRERGRTAGKRIADGRGSRPACHQFLRSLSLRQRHRSRHGHDPGAARGRFHGAGREHGNARARPVPAAWHHGHHHSVRHRSEPRVLRQRLSAARRLLEAGCDFRRPLLRRVHGDRGAVDACHAVIRAR
jgi:hypothetical protein